MNDLVEAANTNDRLQLLNHPAAQAGNLDNDVHPLFYDPIFLETCPHLKQALQLASLFLHYDNLLEFFIPLTFGQERTDSATRKVYLTNPGASKSADELKPYIAEVRKALHCLEHCITYRWEKSDETLSARTTVYNRRPAHTSECSSVFNYKCSVLIFMNEKIRMFYEDEETGYQNSSRCDQFRHDFITAMTLVHELIHAYGVMRRGHLKEPHIRLDHSDSPEWGYAWENFMFGAVINPHERSRLGTHVLLRKTWATQEQADTCGGKEYSAVSVDWVAQWFRKETWDKIEDGGPLAIPSSTVHIKLVPSTYYHRFIVYTDVPETQHDIELIHDEVKKACAEQTRKAAARKTELTRIEEFKKVTATDNKDHCNELRRAKWILTDSETLQQSNVPIPTRIAPKLPTSMSAVAGPLPPRKLSIAARLRSGSSSRSLNTTASTKSSSSSITVVSAEPSSSNLGKRSRDDTAESTASRSVVKHVRAR
jgi:hypothetical protein